jgi:hypothetical protein
MTEAPLELGPPLDYQDFRSGAQDIAKRRREAVDAYEAQAEVAAQAESTYQRIKATQFVTIREGSTATEAENTVKGKTNVRVAQIERDVESEKLKVCMERIKGIDAERASLHKLADWSMKNPAGQE